LEEKCGGVVVKQQKMLQDANSPSMYPRKMKMKIWSNRRKLMLLLKISMLDAIAARKKVTEHKIAREIRI